ncbi:hypothetical protein SLS61_006255 [Didymella pomorum]
MDFQHLSILGGGPDDDSLQAVIPKVYDLPIQDREPAWNILRSDSIRGSVLEKHLHGLVESAALCSACQDLPLKLLLETDKQQARIVQQEHQEETYYLGNAQNLFYSAEKSPGGALRLINGRLPFSRTESAAVFGWLQESMVICKTHKEHEFCHKHFDTRATPQETPPPTRLILIELVDDWRRFQEQVLSKRVLWFTDGEVVFQCRRKIESETGLPIRDINWKQEMSDWLWIVKEYSGRNMTHFEDRTWAIKGPVKFLRKLNNPLKINETIYYLRRCNVELEQEGMLRARVALWPAVGVRRMAYDRLMHCLDAKQDITTVHQPSSFLIENVKELGDYSAIDPDKDGNHGLLSVFGLIGVLLKSICNLSNSGNLGRPVYIMRRGNPNDVHHPCGWAVLDDDVSVEDLSRGPHLADTSLFLVPVMTWATRASSKIKGYEPHIHQALILQFVHPEPYDERNPLRFTEEPESRTRARYREKQDRAKAKAESWMPNVAVGNPSALNPARQIAQATLYNQRWDTSSATNTGQWRGSDHYTIQNSYIASNASNPGVCPTADAQAAPAPPTEPPYDLTSVQTFDEPPGYDTWLSVANLITLSRSISTMIFIRFRFPTVPGTLYEITFDYFISQPQTKTSYRIGVGNSDGTLDVHWDSGATQLQADESYTAFPSASAKDIAAASCIKPKFQPQSPPAYGQWNTGKVALRAHSTQAAFLMNSEGVGGMQWKNFYIRAKDASWCPDAA